MSDDLTRDALNKILDGELSERGWKLLLERQLKALWDAEQTPQGQARIAEKRKKDAEINARYEALQNSKGGPSLTRAELNAIFGFEMFSERGWLLLLERQTLSP